MVPHFLFRLALLVAAACVTCLACYGADARPGDPENKPATAKENPKPEEKLFVVVIVNGRTLSGPNSSAQRRDGRILVPVLSIARELGDVISIDASARSVSVRRQTGSTSDLDARLGQVRENGSLVLSVSNAADIIFPPNAEELLLPAEIVSSLLDISVRYDADKSAVIVARGSGQDPAAQDQGRNSKSGRRFEIYQADYEYNLTRYSSTALHNLTVRAAGRIGDGRFILTSNSTASAIRDASLRTARFDLERPNGQRFTAGDLGTGTDLQFLSATVRGASANIPVSSVNVSAFAGRTYSGVFLPEPDIFLPAGLSAGTGPQIQPKLSVRNSFNYDTNIFGAFVTTNRAVKRSGPGPFSFSAGAMRFSGAGRGGDLLAGGAGFDRSKLRLRGEFAYGKFSGHRANGEHFSGYGMAADIAGTFQVADSLVLQGRYASTGENFLGPQAGFREPIVLKSGGFTWSPGKWFSTSMNVSSSRRPGDSRQNNDYATVSFAITPPRPDLPRIYFSHTESRTSLIRSAAFTMLTASKEFSRFRMYLNATRIKSFGPAAMNAQLGASVPVSDKHSFELSQGIGTSNALNGQFDWRASGLLKNRLSFSAGAGYNYSKTSKLSIFERLTASIALPRESSLQVNYIQSSAGPALLISLRGTLFRRREGNVFLSSPAAEMNSFGKISGRIYQDVNLNGEYDPGTDRPQSEVKVRVDGNRYVVSDENGLYNFDSIAAGDHRVYLDLLSVRADMTFLDADAKSATVRSGVSSVFDFRLVRTGRISGRVWFDANENGKFDEGETPLADIRVVTASGRDTLTDIDGAFSIGDLPPGDHVILIDEKTLPQKTIAGSKPIAVHAFPGRETGDISLPVIALPAEVKRFGAKIN